MKIAIDISRVVESQKTGIPMYQANLFANLLSLSSNHEYLALYYGATANPAKQFMGRDFLTLRNPFMYRNLSLKNLFDRFLARSIRGEKIDLMHSTAYFAVKGLEDRTVLTIHDLIFMRDPEHYNKYFDDLVSGCIGKVRKIIAVSHATKSEILSHFPSLPESRIAVVYEGARDDCSSVTDGSVLREFKKNFFGNEDFKYILFLGSFTKRKNLLNIIKAYDLLVKKHKTTHKLVLVGKPANIYNEMMALIESLNLQQSVIVKGYLEDSSLSNLLSGADVFVFPSYYEGFGLPVIEAMKCGCPCVVSNVSSLGELFSDAAMAVDPDSAADIAGAVYKLVTDRSLHEKYRQLGFIKEKEFNWEKTAKDTQNIYESLF